MIRRLDVVVIACVMASVGLGAETEAERIDFNRDIRGILSNKCFRCHGPDQAERQAGLRLDQRESATTQADSGERAIVPGDPDASELLRRIRSTDDSMRMPPSDTGPPLTDREQQLFKRWIEQGAKYDAHWAYQSPVRYAPPSDAQLRELATQQQLSSTQIEELLVWPRHELDRFVLARQLQNQMVPSPTAPRHVLARRVALDLTGLPPTPEELDGFLQDSSEDAYEKYVETLLNKETYGEHWARRWLDLARYADSAGYADDPERVIWAYRDYVIRAFNANVPYDRFTIEQLAGDLLPDPTEDQLVATAFHRNTQTNNEGGTNDEEYRNVAIVDRVNTTFAVWMGTTMACAQCHSHKYDPISHEDYFRFFAIFNNTADADRRDESPTADVWSAADRLKHQRLQQELDRVNTELQTWTPDLRAAQKEWEQRLTRVPEWKVMDRVSVGVITESSDAAPAGSRNNEQDAGGAGGSFTWEVDGESFEGSDGAPEIAALRMEVATDAEFALGTVVRDGEPVVSPGYGVVTAPATAGRGTTVRYVRILNPGGSRILSLAEVEVISQGQNIAAAGQASQSSTAYAGPPELAIDGNTDGNFEAKSVTHTETEQDPWWELDLRHERPIERVVVWNRTDNNLQSRLKDFTIELLDEGRKVVATSVIALPPDPKHEFVVSDERGVKLLAVNVRHDNPREIEWVPAEAIRLERDTVVRLRAVTTHSTTSQDTASVKLYWTTDSVVRERANVPSELLTTIELPDSQRTPTQQHLLDQYFLDHTPALAALRDQRDQLKKQLAEMRPTTTVPILRELQGPQRRVTHVQQRGNFLALGEQVEPGLPGELFAMEHPQGDVDRLAVARWIVDSDNPLTSRVLVNRYWEAIFGQGIVMTSEEFGSQGDLPTHPKLLDWLATEVIRQGWDLKALLRMLVTSATYLQDSRVTPLGWERDPGNLWLARGPRFRLSAEMVRDQSLAVSGLLSSKMYGPPVKPAQPSLGLSAAFGGGIDWQTSSGEDQYRRAIYTTWRRSNPYPSMSAFDAPNREVCTIRRDRTNTPLQALVTLNDPVYIEAAQSLARHAIASANTAEQQARWAWERCLCRAPSGTELRSIMRLQHESYHRFLDDSDAARRLAGVSGDSGMSQEAVAELASWTAVGNVLMNLDEFLMKP
jgi:hypothetical protein